MVWKGVFSHWGNGVSESPEKIDNIIQEGRPDNVEEVRSLLQACTYNAKFAFNHKEGGNYSDITAPLRKMLVKGAICRWTEEAEASYQSLIKVMSSETTLCRFNPNLEHTLCL